MRPFSFFLLLSLLSTLHSFAGDQDHLSFQRRVHLNGLPERPFIVNNGQLYVVASSGALYRYFPGARFKLQMTNLGTVLIAPLAYSNRIHILNTSNKLTVINPADNSFMNYTLPGSTAILSLFDGNRKLFYATDDDLLYGVSLSTYQAMFAHYIPHLLSLAVSSNSLIASTWDRTRYTINLNDGLIKKIEENFQKEADTDVPLFRDTRIELLAVSNLLCSRQTGGTHSVEFEGLTKSKPYQAFRYGEEIFLHSFDGEILVFRIEHAKKPAINLNPVILFSEPDPKLPGLTVSFKDGAFIINGGQSFSFPTIAPASLKNAERTDLNGDNRPDVVLLFNANSILRYMDIILFLSRTEGDYSAQQYTTIANTNFNDIFKDLNGDGKREMVIVNEVPFNLSKDLDKRILIPDIYSLQKDGYIWDSHHYPEFYQRDILKKRALLATRPFKFAWENDTWALNLNRIIALENELSTLNRQISGATSRQRDRNNLIGLSLWFQKKGLGFSRNNWDNLALLCFRSAKEFNPNDMLILYQISQIYNRYGLYRQSLDQFISTRAQIPFVSSQEVYAMVEQVPDVVASPGQFLISYNLANIYFGLKHFRQAAANYERALKIIDNQPDCLERLIDCYMVMNINDRKVLEMIAYLQKRGYNKKMEDKRQTLVRKMSLR